MSGVHNVVNAVEKGPDGGGPLSMTVEYSTMAVSQTTQGTGNLSLFNVQLPFVIEQKKGVQPVRPLFQGEVTCDDFDNDL
jgi:hypothetical protein